MIVKFWNRVFARNTDTVSCRQVMRLMQEYLDGELAPQDTAKVLKHLETCECCFDEVDLYNRIKSSLLHYQESPSDQAMANVRALATELASTGLPPD